MKDYCIKLLLNVKKDIKKYAISYAILLVLVLLCIIEFDYYIFTPGGLIDVDKRIEVENDIKSDGSFNMTYVSSKLGTLPNILLSYIIPSWDLVPIDEMRISHESKSDVETRNRITLLRGNSSSLIAAFNEAGISYSIKSSELKILYVSEESETDLKVGDTILKVNDTTINTMDDFLDLRKEFKENENIKILVKRGKKEIDCNAVTYKSENENVLGIIVTLLKEVESKQKVTFKVKSTEGGSSGGLIKALEIYNSITKEDITSGDVISGTGTIEEDGTVGLIDGVKYKLSGAVKKKAKVFLVPTENYKEALELKNKYKYNIEIIEADTLHNVIEKLKERK